MSNETLVRVTADASGYTSEMDKAKRSAEAFLTSQEAASKRVQAAQAAITESVANGSDASTRKVNAFMQALTKQAETAGKTRAELLQLQAAQLGVSNSAQQYIDKIAAASEHTNEFSMKTAGARRELLVLAHEASQGNWTRFGGSLMVLGERTDAMGLIFSATGATIGAAALALGVFGLAAIQGALEQSHLNQALMMTGNYAGTTASGLHDLAMAAVQSGGSIGNAKEAVLALASSGQFTSGQIGMISKAAVEMAATMGQSVEDTVKQFEKLSQEPAKAVVELNIKYNFLTAAIYEQILALDEHGNKQAAAQLAEKTYADEMGKRAEEIRSHQGIIESGWDAIKAHAGAAWDVMLGVGRDLSNAEKIQRLLAQKRESGAGTAMIVAPGEFDSVNPSGWSKEKESELQGLIKKDADDQAAAAKKSVGDQLNQAKIAAINRLDAQRKANRSQADLRKDEIDQLNRDAATVGMATDEYNRRVAAINDKHKDPKGAKPKVYTDDAATRFIQSLRDQDAATRAALDSNDKLTGSEKQQAEFLQKIADLKGKSILTAEQKSLLANQDAIKAVFQVNIAHEKTLQLKEDIQKVDERSAQINAQIASYQKSQQEQYQRQLGAIGMGAEAQKNVDAVKSVYKEYEKLQQQLDKDTPKSQIGSSKYLDEKAQIQAQLQASLKDYDDYYAALKAKQADWLNGATAAYANYRDSAANTSQQTEALVTNSFKGMEDALVQFEMTGKLSFTNLANSAIAELDRILIKKQLAKLYDIGSSGGSTGMGLIGTAMNAMGMDLSGSTYGAKDMAAMDGAGGFSLNSGWADALPAFAGGGDPPLNVPSIVGEKGIELFVPRGAGTIIPNDQLQIGKSGQSNQSDQPINLTVNVHGNSNAPDVRRAAGQGAREALAALSGAQRYA